jgi:hypothetical protein
LYEQIAKEIINRFGFNDALETEQQKIISEVIDIIQSHEMDYKKTLRRYKVVSCSGIIDTDLPTLPKCPFYNEFFVECSLDKDVFDNPVSIPIITIPVNCLLRKFNIEVFTDVLNQAEMELGYVKTN